MFDSNMYQLSTIVNETDSAYIRRVIRSAHIGIYVALEMASVHNVRSIAGLTCRGCKFRDVCAKYPAVRQLFVGAGSVDMSSLREEPEFRSDI